MKIFARNAKTSDAEDFARLIYFSAPSFFPALYGRDMKGIMQNLFKEKNNLFSYQYTQVVEINNKVLGIILSYDWYIKQKMNLITGMKMLKYMHINFVKKIPVFLKTKDVVGFLSKGNYYISNIAVYPEYRGRGVGKKLFFEAEKNARKAGSDILALDVETDNFKAIEIYKKNGFVIEKENSVQLKKQLFSFYRMYKDIGR
jgi:ribosomal protein S18 acetylase RimI-like enzyme